MKLPNTLYLAIFALALVPQVRASNGDDVSLASFLGPRPGNTNVYSLSDGGLLKMKGLSGTPSEGIKIQETVVISNLELPEGAAWPSQTYELLVFGDTLVKRTTPNHQVTLLMAPLHGERPPWTVNAQLYKEHDQVEVELECNVVSVDQRVVLSKSKHVVSVECLAKTDTLMIKRTERYAEGIGLIEQITESRAEAAGEQFGEHRLKLKEVVMGQERGTDQQ